MEKVSLYEEFQKKIMDNGVAHLVYCHNGVQDILHPFSVEGYELLSDEFVSFLEKYRNFIPEKSPIALEIVGEPLTKEEKDRIDRTIWVYFCIAMTQNDREVKEIWMTSIRYLIFTLLSTALIVAVNSQMDEVLTNLAYLPFYFFGYRVLIYLLIDSNPVWERRKWYRRLASLELIFSEKESRSFENIDLQKVSEKFTKYEKEAESFVRKNKFFTEYLIENGTAVIGCNVSSLEDVIRVEQLPGKEYTSDTFSDYLIQAEPFLNDNIPVSLHIVGKYFTENERAEILSAIKNFYSLRIASMIEDRKINGRKILTFGLFTLLSIAVLALCGKLVDFGIHEFIIMLLCFFGDYLMEFVLITRKEIKKDIRKLSSVRNMSVIFEEPSDNN